VLFFGAFFKYEAELSQLLKLETSYYIPINFINFLGR